MQNITLEEPLHFDHVASPEEAGMSPQGVEHIRQVFADMLRQGLHPGAQLVVLHHGQVAVDCWAGTAHLGRRTPVLADTPFLVFSVSKPFTALSIHQLAEAGKVDLETRVADYWPEFGCNGKESATLRQVLCHQAGIPARGILRQVWLWPDWERITRSIAALPAEYPPGTRTAYHLVNFGFILGEVVRRVTGMPVQEYIRREFLEPLGMTHTASGLPPDWRTRAAGVYSGHLRQFLAVRLFNIPGIRAAVIPAATIHSTARDLAVFYQMLANQGRYADRQYLKPETIQRATTMVYEGMDYTMGHHMRWALGFHVGGFKTDFPEDPASYGARSSDRTFGHAGQGSCITWADPDTGLVCAFNCNRLLNIDGTCQRWQRLADAIWEAVG